MKQTLLILTSFTAGLLSSCDSEIAPDTGEGPGSDNQAKLEYVDSIYKVYGIDPATMEGVDQFAFNSDESGYFYMVGIDETGNGVINIYSDDKSSVLSKKFPGQDTIKVPGELPLILDHNSGGIDSILTVGPYKLFTWYQSNKDEGGNLYVLHVFLYDMEKNSISRHKFYKRNLTAPDRYVKERISLWQDKYVMFKTELLPSAEWLYECFDGNFNRKFSCMVPMHDPAQDYPLSLTEFITAGKHAISRYKFIDGGNLEEVWITEALIPDNWDVVNKEFSLDGEVLTVTYTIKSPSGTEENREYKVNINTGEKV